MKVKPAGGQAVVLHSLAGTIDLREVPTATIPRVLPLMWLCLCMLAMAILHRFGPGVSILEQPWTWAGLAPGIFGICIAAVSAQGFRKAKTGLLPFQPATTLVTEGFYRYSRNPMYLGMVLFLLGVSMILGTLDSLLPVAAFVLIIDRQYIRREERFMQEAFGDEYERYMARVRRWL